MADDPIQQPMHGESKATFLRSTIFLVFMLVVAFGVFIWSYINYKGADAGEMPAVTNDTPFIQPPPEEPEVRAHEALLAKIEAHVSLPSDSVPEISTVNDAEVLRSSQPFFEQVAVGDTLVVYDDFAIIYRESEDSIINSGKVEDGEPEEEFSEVTTDAPGADVTVDIRNGTAITGYAGRTKDALVTLAYTISSVGNAASNKYDETVIVRKSTVSGDAVKALEEKYGVTATLDLPTGERSSSADIILILGGSE